jgi:cytochrome c biogenesis protein CcdA
MTNRNFKGDLLDPTLVLMVSAALSAIFHTLVPDHEISLAMIGRTQNWTLKKMAGITLIAGVIHISVSMGIGAIALIASAALSRFIANSAQQISGLSLIAFGSIYAFVSWKRKQGGRWHSHGTHQMEHSNEHVHSEKSGISGKKSQLGWGAWIVAIVGIAPCFTLIPVLIAAVPYGATTTLLVMLSYAIATIGMMVILTSIALKTIQYVTKLHRIEKHMEILAGLVILFVGVWLILEISLGL